MDLFVKDFVALFGGAELRERVQLGFCVNYEVWRQEIAIITPQKPRTKAQIPEDSDRCVHAGRGSIGLRAFVGPPCFKRVVNAEGVAFLALMLRNECLEESTRGPSAGKRDRSTVRQHDFKRLRCDVQDAARNMRWRQTRRQIVGPRDFEHGAERFVDRAS